MSVTTVADMTHFLDDTGQVLAGLPPLARFLGMMVQAISVEPWGQRRDVVVSCRRRPGRIPCGGCIFAAVDPESGMIEWRCSRCADHGLISGWQGTPWDMRRATMLAGLTGAAARAWQRVPAEFRLRLLNNVFCVRCGGTVSMAVKGGDVRRPDPVLHGTCTTCGGEVARVIEGVAN